MDMAKAASCLLGIQPGRREEGRSSGTEPGGHTGGLEHGLTGKGVILGVIDSGIDYLHPDFRNEDGSTGFCICGIRIRDRSMTERI